jgi:ATP-dependent Clp protease ATP-binding subunit ClpB
VATSQSGILTSKIEQHPFSLILLDEIEKAYPDILNLFLQVLDEGFLTDAFGKKINFRGAIIIATSNAGAIFLKELLDKKTPPGEIKKKLLDHIIQQGTFKVEFLNRFDDVISFDSLNEGQLKQVTGLILQRLSQKIDSEKNIQITFEENVTEKIIQNGYESIFGARSINRYIADNIEDLIAKKIISQTVQPGQTLVIKESDLS